MRFFLQKSKKNCNELGLKPWQKTIACMLTALGKKPVSNWATWQEITPATIYIIDLLNCILYNNKYNEKTQLCLLSIHHKFINHLIKPQKFLNQLWLTQVNNTKYVPSLYWLGAYAFTLAWLYRLSFYRTPRISNM